MKIELRQERLVRLKREREIERYRDILQDREILPSIPIRTPIPIENKADYEFIKVIGYGIVFMLTMLGLSLICNGLGIPSITN